MTIGDTVRLLHGKEEGIIRRILKDGLIEIEIEDGFTIPVLKSELVLVAASEKQYFNKTAVPATAKKEEEKPLPRAEKGIYLALQPTQMGKYSVILANNTDYAIGCSLVLGSHGMIGAFIAPKQTAQSNSEVMMERLDEWAAVHFQAVYFQSGVFRIKPPFERKLRLKPSTFQQKKPIPLTGKDGFFVQLDGVEAVQLPSVWPQNQPESIVSEQLSYQMKEGEIIDLHIEKLAPELVSASAADILSCQIQQASYYLDQAIAANISQFTLIHGVGAGKLREEIHRLIGKNAHVAFFKDAQKEKFGYGATLIQLT